MLPNNFSSLKDEEYLKEMRQSEDGNDTLVGYLKEEKQNLKCLYKFSSFFRKLFRLIYFFVKSSNIKILVVRINY